jgi:hypothetical protein
MADRVGGSEADQSRKPMRAIHNFLAAVSAKERASLVQDCQRRRLQFPTGTADDPVPCMSSPPWLVTLSDS